MGCVLRVFPSFFCETVLILLMFGCAELYAGVTKESPALLQSEREEKVEVTWQMVKSRMQSVLSGTTTETYAVQWAMHTTAQHSLVSSIYAKVEAPWLPMASYNQIGELTITRSELVRLLGIEREFPPEWNVSEEADLVHITIHTNNTRSMDTVLRFADDNMIVLIRLNARVIRN